MRINTIQRCQKFCLKDGTQRPEEEESIPWPEMPAALELVASGDGMSGHPRRPSIK